MIRTARELNPSILILARTAYIRELATLKQAGANVVFSGEGEVALAFTETILGRLGATPSRSIASAPACTRKLWPSGLRRGLRRLKANEPEPTEEP